MAIVPDDGKKKLLVGTRMASTQERKTQVDDKGNMEELYEKAAEGLQVDGQTQDRF